MAADRRPGTRPRACRHQRPLRGATGKPASQRTPVGLRQARDRAYAPSPERRRPPRLPARSAGARRSDRSTSGVFGTYGKSTRRRGGLSKGAGSADNGDPKFGRSSTPQDAGYGSLDQQPRADGYSTAKLALKLPNVSVGTHTWISLPGRSRVILFSQLGHLTSQSPPPPLVIPSPAGTLQMRSTPHSAHFFQISVKAIFLLHAPLSVYTNPQPVEPRPSAGRVHEQARPRLLVRQHEHVPSPSQLRRLRRTPCIASGSDSGSTSSSALTPPVPMPVSACASNAKTNAPPSRRQTR